MRDADYMRLAIQATWEGLQNGEMPFGATLTRKGKLVSAVHNSARVDTDTTAHAEMQAIRDGTRRLKTLDLSGSVMYATCEPCAMCFSACLWSNIGRIVYACCIADAARFGIRQIPITSEQMKQLSRSKIELTGGLLRDESLELFLAWSRGGTSPGTHKHETPVSQKGR